MAACIGTWRSRFYHAGRLDDAERPFREVLELQPGSSRLHKLIGDIHIRHALLAGSLRHRLSDRALQGPLSRYISGSVYLGLGVTTALTGRKL